jgi:glycosyltransferase involved in cell wall biosynthesis
MATVSVYMPVYNAARFARQAVQSILEQSFSDFEFIIVDDGSTDQTPVILKELAAQDRRIRLIEQSHLGAAAAANRAVAEARGELLARMDGDDIALPRRLERQVDYLAGHPECVAVGSRMMLVDEAGLPLYELPWIMRGHEQIDSALLKGGWPIAQPTCTYRTAAVIAAGGYRADLSLHEDLDLFLRLAERGRLENVPEVLVLYRQSMGSLTWLEGPTSSKVVHSILCDACRRRGLKEPSRLNGAGAKSHASLDRYRQWAWQSLEAGHVRTARKYARKTARLAPLSAHSWKLMYRALRGR